MRRFVAAAAAVVALAASAPAQWSTVDTGAPVYLTAGFPAGDFTFYAVAIYPSGYAAGIDLPTGKYAVRKPDGTRVYPPLAGSTVGAVSVSGGWMAGTVRMGASSFLYRYRLPVAPDDGGDLHLLNAGDNGYSSVSPNAIGEDGVCVATGTSSAGMTAGVWHQNMAWATVVCHYGPLAPDWVLSSCTEIEPNGDGSYTAKGVGYRGFSPQSSYRLTGPLPQ